MEIWRSIPGFEGYEVSNLGNIRRTLKITKRPDGYMVVNISDGKTSRLIGIHRLVGSAFLGLKISDKTSFICHKDDNPENNCLENLFIGTPNDNVQDMIKKGRHKYWSKLNIDQVNEIRKKREEGYSLNALAKEFSVDKTTISRICNGITW